MKHWSDRMNRVVLAASCALALGGVKAAPAAQKVTICHFPPGNPANVQVITVGQAAVSAHITKHNDAVCSAGATNCCFGGSNPSVCTNFQTDVNNCGACGTVCPAGDVCDGGTCQCPTAGQTNCSGTCTDTSTDPNNCGSCGNVCSTGDTCTGGTCVSPCPPGDITCQGTCVDPNTDPNNCGACGTQCSTGQVCKSGTCTTNPNPECTGETCSTFTGCNLSTCGGAGVCGSTAEGGGLCVNGSTPCGSLATCTTSADCPSGVICIVMSCCGGGVCVPPSDFCASPSGAFLE